VSDKSDYHQGTVPPDKHLVGHISLSSDNNIRLQNRSTTLNGGTSLSLFGYEDISVLVGQVFLPSDNTFGL
jgi:hypothetical protein